MSQGKAPVELVYSMYIISNEGSLLYQRDLHPAVSHISADTHLLLGSIFHALHTVSAHEIGPVSPSPSSSALSPSLTPLSELQGIETVESSNFTLHCHRTLTGLKVLLITTPRFGPIAPVFKRVMIHYTDYVLKNPFYVTNEPIRCHMFDSKIAAVIAGRG